VLKEKGIAEHVLGRWRKARSPKGAVIIFLGAILGLIILPMLAILSFEIARVFLAQQQLQNASDAAVLTATAQLASSDNSNPTAAHNNAIAAALSVFQQNYLLGAQLNNSAIVGSASALSCSPGQAKLVFSFYDPSTKPPSLVPISSPNGKIINLQSCAGAYLAFGAYLGIPSFQVSAVSKGAVPILDIQICFDVSGSMDDQTPVTFIKRVWDTTLPALDGSGTGRIVYDIPAGGTTGSAQGTIANILLPPPTGTSLNASYPQFLEESWPNPQSTYGNPLEFTWDAASNNLRSLNGYPDVGNPPGNYPNNPDPFSDNLHYTDVVTNIDGNTIFNPTNSSPYIINGFNFPNIATVVEAARGNLENMAVFKSSKANTAVPPSVVPTAGYQSAYLAAVTPLLQPITNSQAATLLFADILNTDTDCHFGLTAFDGEVGVPGPNNPAIVSVAGQSYEQTNSIDQGSWANGNATYGPLSNYPEPFIPLNPTFAQTNYSTVVSAIQSTVALGGTNIGLALDTAVKDLQANGRTGSVKAIVLFTDGEPTDGQPLDQDPSTNARLAAIEASNAGYPIYTIGLAQTAAIEPSEVAILNDTNSNTSTGGIAAIAGHGGTFNLVTNSSQLRATFEKIARRLVEIVASSAGDY